MYLPQSANVFSQLSAVSGTIFIFIPFWIIKLNVRSRRRSPARFYKGLAKRYSFHLYSLFFFNAISNRNLKARNGRFASSESAEQRTCSCSILKDTWRSLRRREFLNGEISCRADEISGGLTQRNGFAALMRSEQHLGSETMLRKTLRFPT